MTETVQENIPNTEPKIKKDENQIPENQTKSVEQQLQKKSKNYFLPIIVISILLFLYYIIFMRRTFIRSDERFPFFWDETLNKTLKKYVNIFPSRYVLFVNGPYKSGKSRTLYKLSEDLNRKEGRLVINFNFDSYNSSISLLQQMKIDIQNSLIAVRPFLSSYSLKQAQLIKVETITQMPIGLDQSLYGIYNNLVGPLDSIIESIQKSKNISSSKVWDFVDTLNKYHESLNPVIFVHSIDNLIRFGTPIFEIFRSYLLRKNQYEDNVPIVIEIHDSTLLYSPNEQILDGFGSMNQYRLATTKGALNESAADILIRSRLFTSTEIRKLQREFGSHGGVWSDVLEDLRYGIKLETVVLNKQKQIEADVKSLIISSKNSQSRLLEQKISKLLTKLCRSRGDYFFPEREVMTLLGNLYKYGYIYDDETMTTHVANKAVYHAICSSK